MSDDRLGKNGGPYSAGPGGECECTSCGYREPHTSGEPCTKKSCPRCGAGMKRFGYGKRT